MKRKKKMIDIKEFSSIYEELCSARKPSVQFSDDTEDMLRQAMFLKDKAINAIVNFLYNQGINS